MSAFAEFLFEVFPWLQGRHQPSAEDQPVSASEDSSSRRDMPVVTKQEVENWIEGYTDATRLVEKLAATQMGCNYYAFQKLLSIDVYCRTRATELGRRFYESDQDPFSFEKQDRR